LPPRLDRRQVTVLAVAPGWVRTDMGGRGASLSVEESVRGIVDILEAAPVPAGTALSITAAVTSRGKR